jgi:hypothetical protein
MSARERGEDVLATRDFRAHDQDLDGMCDCNDGEELVCDPDFLACVCVFESCLHMRVACFHTASSFLRIETSATKRGK